MPLILLPPEPVHLFGENFLFLFMANLIFNKQKFYIEYLLLERKILGYIHIRKGPNKVGFIGILQPFRDAIELFTREQTFPLISNKISYYFA